MQRWLGYLWQALFILFYPFLTLFSVVFTALIRLFSQLSATLTRIFQSKEQAVAGEPQADEEILFGTDKLIFQFETEIHFGPKLYTLKQAPSYARQLQGKFFSLWHYACANQLLLQHWPSVKEHELESYELIGLNKTVAAVETLGQFRDFDWQVREENAFILVSCASTQEQVQLLKQ